MTRQAWIAWLMIALQAVLFWYLSTTTVFPVLIVAISLPAVLWRHRWELSPAQLPLIDLALATVCTLKWFFLPHDPPSVVGFVMYAQMHAAGQFFLLAQVARLWSRRTGRTLPVYLPLLAVLVFICLGDMDVSRRQRRMFEWGTLSLVGLTALYYSASRRREPRADAARVRWLRTGLSLSIFLAVGWGARTGNAWVLDRWLELEQMLLRATASRARPQRSDAMIGFSAHAHLASVRLLKAQEEQNVALRVVSEHFPGYLRGKIFNHFQTHGWEWQTDMFQRQALPAGTSWRPSTVPAAPLAKCFPLRPMFGESLRQMVVWRDASVDRFAFAPGSACLLEASVPYLAMDRLGAVSGDNFPPGGSYTVWQNRSVESAQREPMWQPLDWTPAVPYEISSAETEQARESFLDLPRIDPRVRRLATELFAECQTDREKIDAVRDYFTRNYRYNPGLEIPREWERDPVAYFLLERPAAHCEYFATAAAVLLRLGGIPSRFVTGFAGGELHELAGYWIVRHSDAHAWAEAYLPNEGWTLVETTPGEGVPLGRTTFSLWYLFDEISLRGQMIREALSSGQLDGWWRAAQLILLTLLTTVPGWMLTSGALYLLARQIRPGHRRPRAIPEPRDVQELQKLRETVDRWLRSLRLERAADETLHQFAQRLRCLGESDGALDRVADWYTAYAATRYGTVHRETQGQFLAKELPDLRAQLRRLRAPAQREQTGE